MTHDHPLSSFGQMLRIALRDAAAEDAGDDFLAMCAEDIRFEFPFAPEGTVTEVRGKERMRAYLSRVGALIDFEGMSQPAVHRVEGGETFIIEFSCAGSGAAGRYDQGYISVITIAEGRIRRYRDYWNPLILLDAVGGVEVLRSQLADFVAE